MTILAAVLGVEKIDAKLRRLGGPQALAKLRAANQKSANEFRAMVERTIPRGGEDRGHLVTSLKTYDTGPVGVAVSIGDDAHPYPLHLEVGHRNPDGGHVPGKPFWNPSKRVLAKRARNRAKRAMREVAKSIAAAGGA